MDTRSIALILILGGVLLVIAGVLALSGGLGWFGRLPGDLRVERGNVRVFVPIVSMLVLSVMFSLLVALLRRWL